MKHDWTLVDFGYYSHHRCSRCDHIYTGKYTPDPELLISVDDERRPDGSFLLRDCDEMIILRVQES